MTNNLKAGHSKSNPKQINQPKPVPGIPSRYGRSSDFTLAFVHGMCR